jgi:uncharacterized protein (TIGR00730 family)
LLIDQSISIILKRIAIFCGSSLGGESLFQEQAYLVGRSLAEHRIGVIYGGAKIGLMGAVADGALTYGGEVIGILPAFLQRKEIAHDKLTELIIVTSMHERKMKMHDLSDGVIALPGGFGTLEELFEMLTWAQLGLHTKPIALLNIDGFFDPLLNLIDVMVKKGFLRNENQQMLLVADNVSTLLSKMNNYRAPNVGKWITKETT